MRSAGYNSAPAPWAWVILGIAAILFAGLFVYRMTSKKAEIPQEAQPDAAVTPQQPPTENM